MERSRPTYEYAFNPDAPNDTAATVYRLAREGGDRILDLGSGPAIVSSYLKRADGKQVTCVDGDAGRLEVARGRGVDRVVLGDLEGSEWASTLRGEAFDVVILADVLEHLRHPELPLRLIREHGLLSPEGFLVVSIPNAAHEAVVAELLSDRFRYREAGLLDATHIRFFTRDTLMELLEGEGFVVSRLHRTIIPLERTEMASAAATLPAEVREQIGAMPEGRTYQFVVRAEPAVEARRLKELHERVRVLEDERDRLGASAAALKARREAEVARARAELGRVATENRALKRKLAGLYASRTWKVGRIVAGGGRALVHPIATLRRVRGRRRRAAPDRTAGDRASAPPAAPQARPAPEAPGEAVDVGTPASPAVSVVIPAFNGLEMTRRCLDSIDDSAGETPFEVVVADNGSSDWTREWLLQEALVRPNLVAVFNDRNLGFAGGVNSGARRAAGRVIVICNNDVIVTLGWLDRLGKVLDAHPEIGILSPVTNQVREDAQRDPDAASATVGNVAEFDRRAAGRAGQLRVVRDALVFFCVAVRAELFDVLGGLSEDFGLGNFEDDDFCVRARMLGVELAVDPSVFVYHHGNATWTSQNISHAEWMTRNRGVYLRKLSAYSLGATGRRRSTAAAPKISVIVRTKDRPELLRDALTSLANQTFEDFEVVVVDDGGRDVSAMLDRFSGALVVNAVRHDEPRGRAEALNAGLRAARAPWIAYLDDDDVAYPLHLDVLYDAALRSRRHVVYADSALSLARTGPAGATTVLGRRMRAGFPYDADHLMVENRIPIHAFLHAASCVEEVGGFDPSLDLLEEWDFLLRLAARHPFLRVPRVTSESRFRAGPEPDNVLVTSSDEVVETIGILYKRYPAAGPGVEERRASFLGRRRAASEDLRRIYETTPDHERAALLAACRITGFRPTGA